MFAANMATSDRIREKLTSAFEPKFLDLINESDMHSVPKGSETHFRLVLVSAKFEGLSRIARSRKVHEVLVCELKGGVHALTQRLHTPEEWSELNETVETASPPCLGGAKSLGGAKKPGSDHR